MSMQGKYLYRVLRNDEDHRKGLTAKDSDERKIVADHVQYGRHSASQFISTTTSLEAAIKFVSKGKHWPKVVVRINVAELQKYDHIEIIDLTCEHILNKHISSERTTSRFYAKKNKEVLIKGFIPPSCVTFERLIRQSFRLSYKPVRRKRSYRSSSLDEAQASNMIRYDNVNQPDTWYSHYENHSNVQFQTQHWQDEYFPETNYYDGYSRYAHVTHYEQYSNLWFQTPNWQNRYFSNADYDGYSRRSDVTQYEQYLNLRFPTPDWHDEYIFRTLITKGTVEVNTSHRMRKIPDCVRFQTSNWKT